MKIPWYFRWLILSIVVAITSVVLSLTPWAPDANTISTIFTVAGIIFSVGLGLIVSIDLQGIKNKEFRKILKRQIDTVKKTFVVYFCSLSLLYIIFYNSVDTQANAGLIIKQIVILKSNILLLSYGALCIIYFVINFYQIQKLHETISDIIDDESK